MNQKQNDELKMLETVFALLFENNAKITPIADLLDGRTQLEDYIKDLRKKRDLQVIDNKGIAKNKADLRIKVVQEILDLSGPLVNLGRKTGNNTLIEEFNFSKSFLEKLRDDDLVSVAGNTAAAANTNILLLAPGGVTPAMVTLLNADLELLIGAINAPETAIQVKKVATQNIKATFPLTRTLIDETLTTLMRTNFRTSDSDFFNQYIASTEIISTGIRHLSIYGSIIDSVSGTKINAAVLRILLGASEVAKVKSGKKGNFRVKNLSEGSYSVEITRPGYQPKTIPAIVVIVGQGTRITITLIAL